MSISRQCLDNAVCYGCTKRSYSFAINRSVVVPFRSALERDDTNRGVRAQHVAIFSPVPFDHILNSGLKAACYSVD